MPRILGFWTGFPILGTSLISSLILRVTVALGLGIWLHPLMTGQYADFSEVPFSYAATFKEFILGWMSGFVLSLPLWVCLMIGDIVESQRGGMATDNADPFTGVQSSVYGALIVSTLFLQIMMYGPFEQLLKFLYTSYTIWPVDSYFPTYELGHVNGILVFNTLLFDTVVLLATPLLLMMFMCEFGLALVNRFSPALNVFILSMPVKSVISVFVLWIVLESMVNYLLQYFGTSSVLFSIVNGVAQ